LDLVDCIAVVNAAHKKTGSTEGHAIAGTSPLQKARIEDAPRRLEICRKAILTKIFEAFANIIEHDSDMMHAVMMTSNPPLNVLAGGYRGYLSCGAWMARKRTSRRLYSGCRGECACPLPARTSRRVEKRLRILPGVGDILVAGVGGPARIV